MIVDHVHHDGEDQFGWQPDYFQLLKNRINITEVNVDCFFLDEDNVTEFIDILAGMKYCRVIIPERKRDSRKYQFSVNDIELMAEKGVKVVKIDSSAIRYDSLGSVLSRSIQTFKKFKYLEEISFTDEAFVEPPPIEVYAGLPITAITTEHIMLDENNLKDVIETLSQIKTLTSFSVGAIMPILLKDQFMTPELFIMFKRLPVKTVDLTGFYFTEENVPVFRKIMTEMQIMDIYVPEYSMMDISVKTHGPDGIYKTI